MTDREKIARAQSGDKQAMERLVADNLALVRSFAAKFYGRGAEFDDLVQIGAIGLIKAIRNFDPTRAVELSTYASALIIGEMRRALRDASPFSADRRAREIARRAAYINEREGRGIGIEEIASEIGVRCEEVAAALCAAERPLPLDDIENTVASPMREDAALSHVMIDSALSRLPLRERKIIIMRYFREKTQAEVSRELGVSQAQVSRLEKKALEKLGGELV